MKLNKWIVLLCLLSVVMTLLLFNQLPEQVPRHWNIHGEVDAYSGKVGVLFTALLPLGLYLLMIFLPKIDPKRKSYTKHVKAYLMTQYVIVIFMLIIHWSTIGFAMGYPINISKVVLIGIGIMFIIIGNYMTQIRQNFFFGIKTPWTLSNEVVWKKTHRLGGYMFMASGMVSILSSVLKGSLGYYLMFTTIMLAAFVPIIYSYLLFKKEQL